MICGRPFKDVYLLRKDLKGFALRGQTVHWIGAQFCVCMFLESRDKSLNMLKFCRNDQRKVKNKRKTKERPCCGICIHAQNAQFGLAM